MRLGLISLLLAMSTTPALAQPSARAEGSEAAEALATAERLGSAFSAVAEAVSPSVVSIHIEARREMPGFFGQPSGRSGIARGNGSGVIIRRDGYVVTNNHVVAGADHIEVRLRDGRRFGGVVVGVDPATDLAVLKIEATDLPTAPFADVSRVRVGQWVVAIGSPFGLDYTVTAGLLSAVGRGGLGANEIEDYLQTDASINPGNSGGPLVDLHGRVLGINTMIVGRASGIGFAVPADMVRDVAAQLIEAGVVRRPWFGVGYQDLTPELAAALGVPGGRGALLSGVRPGLPAAQAGLVAGDVVVSVGGAPIRSGLELQRAVLRAGVGQPMRLVVLRQGRRRNITVTTAERPTRQRRTARPRRRAPQTRTAAPDLGLVLRTLDRGEATRLRWRGPLGVVVLSVVPGSPADRGGARRGDVIVEADRAAVAGEQQVRAALQDGSVLLRVRRQSGARFLMLTRPTTAAAPSP